MVFEALESGIGARGLEKWGWGGGKLLSGRNSTNLGAQTPLGILLYVR